MGYPSHSAVPIRVAADGVGNAAERRRRLLERQRDQLVPGQLERGIDHAGDAQAPVLDVHDRYPQRSVDAVEAGVRW